MVKKYEIWYCDICGKEAKYHVCITGKHEYYCDEHWGLGKPKEEKC